MPPDLVEQSAASSARRAMFTASRFVAALALYPWFMGRLEELSRALALPLSHQVNEQGVSCAAALLTLLLITVGVERRTLSSAGFRRQGALRDFGLGALVGAAMVSAIVAFLALAGWYRLTGPLATDALSTSQARLWLVLLLAAAAEEIMFRGLVFRILEEGVGSFLAVLLSAAYFSSQHADNPSVSSAGLLGIAFAGVFFGVAYMATRSLWLVIGIHWAWNLFEGPIFGAPVSGYQLQSVFHADIEGPGIWTGGDFGPEAGLPLFVISSLFTTVAIVIARRNGRVLPLRRVQHPVLRAAQDEIIPPQNPPLP